MQTAPTSVAREQFGLAFEIPDLLLAQAFAASCALRMVVEINHHTDHDELDEVIALYPAGSTACQCLIWRSAAAVVVQPALQRQWHFVRLSDALDWLQPEEPVTASDIAVAGLCTSHAFRPCQ